jgi:hypothetical protein
MSTTKTSLADQHARVAQKVLDDIENIGTTQTGPTKLELVQRYNTFLDAAPKHGALPGIHADPVIEPKTGSVEKPESSSSSAPAPFFPSPTPAPVPLSSSSPATPASVHP